jgi:hypothetical protein
MMGGPRPLLAGRGVLQPTVWRIEVLDGVDRMLERAKAVTRHQRWTSIEYA